MFRPVSELTEEELPEGSAPDLLAELELAPDDVIHLRLPPPPDGTNTVPCEIRARRR